MLQVSKVQGATPIIAGNGDSWSAFETAFQHLFLGAARPASAPYDPRALE